MGLKITGNTLDTIPSPLADVSFNSHKETNVLDPVNAQDGATKNYVDQSVAAISQNTGSQVISGCGVAWSGTGLQFVVSAGTYSINGTTYSVVQTTVTLSAADATNPRIDLIIVDTTSTATKITGTPAANPVAPSVDPSSQLQLTFVTVAAGATTPSVTNTLAYDENVGAPTEWNSSSSGATWNLASTNNPYSGTKDIEATTVGTGAYAQLQKGSGTLDPSTQNALIFFIRSKATFPNNRSITISLLNGGTQQGAAISLRDGVYGFVSSTTTAYQQIVIPITAFTVGNSAINQVRFTIAGSGGTIGFYLDLIIFQSGVNAATQNFLVLRGAWSSTNAYAKNDVVVEGRNLWGCLIANSNSQPNEGNTSWQWLNSQNNITRNDYGSLSVPDTGILLQPTRSTSSSSSRVIVSGTGRSTVFDPSNLVAMKGTYNPPVFILRQGEFLRQNTELRSNGNERVTLTEDARIFLTSEPANPSFPYWDAILQVPVDMVVSTTGVLIDINGLVYSGNPNTRYELNAMLLGQSSDTNGVAFSVKSPGATGSYLAFAPTSAAASGGGTNALGVALASAVWTVATTDLHAQIRAILTTGTGALPPISIQVQKSSAGSVTIRAGSVMRIKKLS